MPSTFSFSLTMSTTPSIATNNIFNCWNWTKTFRKTLSLQRRALMPNVTGLRFKCCWMWSPTVRLSKPYKATKCSNSTSWSTTRPCHPVEPCPRPTWPRCCRSARLSWWTTTSKRWQSMLDFLSSHYLLRQPALCTSTVRQDQTSQQSSANFEQRVMVNSACD